MSRTVIDLNNGQTLGTSTTREAVDTALREALEHRRRALALTRLRAAVEEGAFELDLIEVKRNRRG